MWIECVPNFSEGRRIEVVDAIQEAILSVSHVLCLDRHFDADHNRSVFTFCGPIEAVEQAAFRAAEVARDRIDLREHDGVHPRIGAMDVCPFVPIGRTPMEACIRVAERFAERLATRLDIPTYLYAKAARHEDYVRVADIRRGGFEELKTAIATDRPPDFGPNQVHPSAGATVVGARFFLIAYNIVLDTNDLRLAQQIAQTIRESSGGFPGVQALGLPLESQGRVQVSTNLLDYRVTSLGRVFRKVALMANEAKVDVLESEIVGLVPRAALQRAAVEGLSLPDDELPLLEDYIDSRLPGPKHVREFLTDLSSTAPTPGGGSGAAVSCALAAGVLEKVVRLSTRNRKGPEKKLAPLRKLRTRLLDLREECLGLADRDAEAFEALLAAQRSSNASTEEAALAAAQSAAAILDVAAELVRIAGDLPNLARRSVAEDIPVGLELARGAGRAAHHLATVNLKLCSTENKEGAKLEKACKTALAALSSSGRKKKGGAPRKKR